MKYLGYRLGVHPLHVVVDALVLHDGGAHLPLAAAAERHEPTRVDAKRDAPMGTPLESRVVAEYFPGCVSPGRAGLACGECIPEEREGEDRQAGSHEAHFAPLESESGQNEQHDRDSEQDGPNGWAQCTNGEHHLVPPFVEVSVPVSDSPRTLGTTQVQPGVR